MSSPRTRKFKSVLSASKEILTLFWDFHGSILKHCQDMGRESIEPSNMLYLKRSSNPLFTANTEE
jgi:hypothetical protein